MTNQSNLILWLFMASVCFIGCSENNSQVSNLENLSASIAVCGSPDREWLEQAKLILESKLPNHPRILGQRKNSPYPLIQPNDNRTPAGRLSNEILELELDVNWGDFRVETDDHPGLLVVAIGEKGKLQAFPHP